MKRPIFTFLTGTPTARALSALPPTAKIQLPILVRCRIQAARITKMIHHKTVIASRIPPIFERGGEDQVE